MGDFAFEAFQQFFTDRKIFAKVNYNFDENMCYMELPKSLFLPIIYASVEGENKRDAKNLAAEDILRQLYERDVSPTSQQRLND